MFQSRIQSAVESVANVVVGYAVAIVSQIAVFPWFGIDIPLSSNLAIGAWFTVISLVRSYVLRRWFNGLRFRGGQSMEKRMDVRRANEEAKNGGAA